MFDKPISNKKIIIPFITIVFSLLTSQNTNAQINNSAVINASSDVDDLNPEGNLEEQLIPLEEIIPIAIENSPYMKYDAAMIENRRNNLTLIKRDWQTDIAATGLYTRGNQQYTYVNLPGNSPYSLLNGYRYGVTATIPLSDITLRGAKIRAGQAELDAYRHKREQTQLMLKRQVIEEYTNLISSQKLVKIKNEGRENARVAYQMVEKQFKEASVQLSEVTRANEALIGSETLYQVSISEFRISYLNFQELVGVKLSTLKRKK